MPLDVQIIAQAEQYLKEIIQRQGGFKFEVQF
jgi:hypothetical protein